MCSTTERYLAFIKSCVKKRKIYKAKLLKDISNGILPEPVTCTTAGIGVYGKSSPRLSIETNCKICKALIPRNEHEM